MEYLANDWTIKVVSEFVERGGWVRESTRSIPPNLNSFSGKNTKNAWKWRNLHCWQKFYTWQNGYFCPQICSKFNDLFMIEWLVGGSRQEMGKSTPGLALSAQLIDLPLLPKVQWHLVEKARFTLSKSLLIAFMGLLLPCFLAKRSLCRLK